jgi:hypothetical protein
MVIVTQENNILNLMNSITGQDMEKLYSLLSFYDQLSDIPVPKGYVIHPTSNKPHKQTTKQRSCNLTIQK